MELYHGSIKVVERPTITSDSNVYDFGRGFYVTASFQKARMWMQMRMQETLAEEGYINTYEFDEKAMDSLNCLIFKSVSLRWLNFVMDNRTKRDFSHDYDIVVGPVASDDDAYMQLVDVEEGILFKSSTLKKIRSFRLMDQYLFHTPRALEALQFKRASFPINSKNMQEDLHLFTPTKVRWLVEYLHDDYGLSIEDCLDRIYHSNLYNKLSTANTRYWQRSPVDLYKELLGELGDLGKKK